MKKLLAVVLLLMSAGFLAAQSPTGEPIPYFEIPDSAALGMGGTHVAFADDFRVFWQNPAGLANLKTHLAVSELGAEVDDVETINTLLRSGINNPQTIVNLLDNHIHTMAEFAGPLSVGWVNKGFGVGLANATRLEVVFRNSNIIFPRVVFAESFAFFGGYAYRIQNYDRRFSLDIGLAGKFLFRMAVDDAAYQVQEIQDLMQQIGSRPFEMHLAGGFDFGIRGSWKDFFMFGVSFLDFFSTGHKWYYDNASNWRAGDSYNDVNGEFRPRLQAGIAFSIKPEALQRWISEIRVAADYRGFWDLISPASDSLSPDLQFGVGLGVKLLDALWLRAGFSQLLPSGGIGVETTAFKLDFAFFGKQFGTRHGELVKFAFSISLVFRYDLSALRARRAISPSRGTFPEPPQEIVLPAL